ncbi:MAG: TIGR00159 family protein [Clostridiales bacterium]|jgi:diadenylate cyclase|nr:TIGR00159 family protein [Clostridiales bacterium]
MESILDFASKTWDFFVSLVSSAGIFDLLDIAMVAVLLYFIYVFIRDRRAGKLAAGVVILILLQLLAELLELNAMRFIMQNVFQVGLLALVVVFQPELRSALEKVGSEPLRGLKSIGEIRDASKSAAWIKPLCDAVTDMAAERTGAIIVIELTTPLGDIAAGGIIVNADMSSYLLKNIFFNKAPLHDGAVIIRGGRIWAASCFLPISTNKEIAESLGTRHRAAIGMSENSDAYVIVVSEETGTVSVAHDGELHRGYDYNRLKSELEGLKYKHIYGG